MSESNASTALEDPPAAATGLGSRQLKAFTGLTAVQVLQVVAGLITGPLLARALGAEGRGLLAAIAVPLGVAPFVAQLGLGAFAVNRTAGGMSPSRVFGSVGVPLVAVGALVAISAPWLADVFSEGREPVDEYLTVGFILLPVALLLNLALDIAWGLSAWRVLALSRFLVTAGALIAVSALYLAQELSVASAATVTIVSGLAPILVLAPIFRRISVPRVDLAMTRAALGFGLRAWPGTLASLANQRFDQLLMIPLVPARELGLYAVAVTVASLSTVLSSQIVTIVLPRIAGGEYGLVPVALRCQFLVVVATQVALAVGTFFLLAPIFGADFAAAERLVFVLLIGWLAQSGVSLLAQSLAATGRPGAPSLAEIASLAVTIPGLLILLPPFGAMGAALVTTAAYVVTLAILLVVSSRHFGGHISAYVLPRRGDVRTLKRFALPLWRRLTRS